MIANTPLDHSIAANPFAVDHTQPLSLSKVQPIESLVLRVKQLQKANQRVGLCHGCFDVLHTGHIRHFEAARRQCDVLVVSVTPDRFVNKGPGRPVFGAPDRAELIAALSVVDYVMISNWPSAVQLLQTLRPNCFFKGQEYETHAQQVNPNFLEEREMAVQLGIDVLFTYEKVNSSTATLKVYENKRKAAFPAR
jgi:rfaE bifunctional protein nucleotidyltransferase chain/domain